MEGSIEQSDGDGQWRHGLEYRCQVDPLDGSQLLERRSPLARILGQEEPADYREAVAQEHVLGPAEADALCTEGPGPGCVVGPVGVGPHPHPVTANLVGPRQKQVEFGDLVGDGHLGGSGEHLARRAVQRDSRPFLQTAPSQDGVVAGHLEVGQAHHRRDAPAACHHGRVAGHASTGRHDAIGELHADLVGRRGLIAYQHRRLATVRSIQDRLGGQAQHPAGQARAGADAAAQHLEARPVPQAGVQERLDQRRGDGGHRGPARLGAVGRRCIGDKASKVVRVLHNPSLARHPGGERAGRSGQAVSRLARWSTRPSIGTLSWAIESRSRTVTARSSRVSKSMVTQYGVPISSWRR